MEKEIYYAINFNEVDNLKRLLNKDNVNHKIKEGYPIHYAVFKNNYQITKYLIGLGANLNARFEDGSTPLITAAENGAAQICELLLENKASVNLVDNYGNDALVKAVLYGRKDIIKLLLQYGADPDNKAVKGKTAIDLAVEMKSDDILTMLKGRTT